MGDSGSRGGSGMGFLGWILVAVIVLGLLGYGPCASTCQDCGPSHNHSSHK